MHQLGRYVKQKAAGWLAVATLFLSVPGSAQTSWNPRNYWTFDQTDPLVDNTGTDRLNPNYYNSVYSINNASSGSVGKSLKLTDPSRIIVATSPFQPTSAFTVEFLFKADPNLNNTIQFFSRRDGGINLRFSFAEFRFTTRSKPNGSSVAVTDNFQVPLNGIGRASYGYYVDGNWHHLVFRYDAVTGTKQIWVDGQLPAGFSKTLPAGTIPSVSSNINEFICDLNTNTEYYKVYGSMDEIALYSTALSGNMIYKHYQEFQNGNHYTFTNTSTPAPAPAPVTGTIDPLEYAPGHPSPNVDAWTQLITFPTPRYKKGHTMYSNVPVFNPAYFTGYLPGQQVTNTYIQKSKQFQLEMAKNFNYSLMVASNTHNYYNFGDTTKFDGAWIKMANQNPQYRASANSYWPQLTPTSAGFKASDNYVQCGCLPNTSYLRNAAGQYIDESGNVTSSKKLSPQAPLDSIRQDGKTQRYYLTQLTNKLTRPLDVIFENGEILPWYKANGLQNDPTVVAAKNAMGVDWNTYIGRNFNRINQAYKSEFMSLPALSNTRFTYYQIAGHPVYNWKYSETRTLNTAMNNQVYSSMDFYPVRPENWRYWSGAWHGWQFLVDARHHELAAGDNLFSPTVSPGWNNDETTILRPAQWMGLLKAVAMTGAEYFHTAYFFLKVPYQNPADFVWQVSIPSYVQGVSSRYEDILRNGHLMDGDYPNDPVSNPTQPGYSFYSGDVRKLVVARKHNTSPKYAITGTIQPNSNAVGNAELESVATIKLDGQNIKFNVRRQGSTYIYDKTNASSPVFYQIDGWHEHKHPYHWSKTFDIEGELFDNNNSALAIRTRLPQGAQAGDFTNYTTSVDFNAATFAEYYFTPRGTAPATHYVWVRARSTNGSTANFTVSLDNANTKNISCVTDTNWLWYRVDAGTGNAISFSSLSLAEHKLTIASSNGNLEIDRITITPNSGAIYTSGVANPCGVTAIANITPSGSTALCAGNTVTLTANNGSSYSWSNGATTKSIVVSTAGTYVVTVTTNGVSAVSAPVIVTVGTAQAATITASGSTALCGGGSVTLTASSASSYQWSTGATTRSITVSNAGNYIVTCTNSTGCSATSQATAVTSGSGTTPVISANGATSICQGKAVTLTSTVAGSYLWSNGATTRSINVSSSGTYSVTANPGSACSSGSNTINVTVKPNPNPVFSTSGPLSFCNGNSVTISSSTNSAYSYVWFKNNSVMSGQVGNTYRATTPGAYKVRVMQNGCVKYSGSYNVTVPCREGEELPAAGTMDASVYPNPASDMTTISFVNSQDQNVTVELMDAQGKLLETIMEKSLVGEGRHEINYSTSSLSKGVYMIRVYSDNESRVIRMICI